MLQDTMTQNNKDFEFDAATIIGRWQLWHLGHASLMQEALRLAPLVIVVIGSSFKARDPRNPFTATERTQMILATLSEAERKRVLFLPVRDYYDDDKWNDAVRKGVQALTRRVDRIALVGFKKDHTSYYLDGFPGWQLRQVEPQHDIDATALRRVFFETPDPQAADDVMGNYVHTGALAYLRAWSKLPAYERCAKEHAAVTQYRKDWSADWYLTADPVVRVCDHILMVRRGGVIGQGLWALPGGFVDKGERMLPAALRELKEETGLAPLASTMRAALRGSAVFDHPLRSPRGRLVTHAFYFALGYSNLPEVHGADDAQEARWIPIAELGNMEDQIFEDHYAIITHFVGEPH